VPAKTMFRIRRIGFASIGWVSIPFIRPANDPFGPIVDDARAA
jgi:hypothetical protein